MRFVALVVGLMTLVGCADGGSADQIARETAKGVVNTVVSSRFPGMNAAPITDCIIDNAEITEVYKIAEAAVVGPGPETTRLILDIARRPATVQCAADETLNGLVLGI
ncbi:succinate dehydrogenase [Yoonia sp. 2307UL14-13]|uniref:succinate dehydrogenase n=1 Tax=Yoonia sp. 2307UL14-13 TaxID=3126506 RepID=UPI0030A5C449